MFQAYDFYHLYTAYGCRVQLGGSDQWGNITAGTDLIRRMLRSGEATAAPTHSATSEGERSESAITHAAESAESAAVSTDCHGEAYAVTLPLLTTKSGAKYGKSAGNAIWLCPTLTSPYELYQFLLQTADDEVGLRLRQLTLLPLSAIADLEAVHAAAPERRAAQHALAREVRHFQVLCLCGERAWLWRFVWDVLLSFLYVERAKSLSARRACLPLIFLAGSAIDFVVCRVRVCPDIACGDVLSSLSVKSCLGGGEYNLRARAHTREIEREIARARKRESARARSSFPLADNIVPLGHLLVIVFLILFSLLLQGGLLGAWRSRCARGEALHGGSAWLRCCLQHTKRCRSHSRLWQSAERRRTTGAGEDANSRW